MPGVGVSTRDLDRGSTVEGSLRHPYRIHGSGVRRVSVERSDFPCEATGLRRARNAAEGAGL